METENEFQRGNYVCAAMRDRQRGLSYKFPAVGVEYSSYEQRHLGSIINPGGILVSRNVINL